MEKLFVEKSIKVNTPASRVWDVLTKPEFTDQWALEFSGGAELGNVTALEPNKFLRFTVFDVRGEKPPVTEEDGITYELTEQNGETMLRLSQGDFSVMAEGEKYHRLSAEVWDRVLPKVKELAEK
ncbi:MAG: SRPBCC domain-containing protein [Chloroflexi bacterium]|nr:MAG: SRPBCC domain-containing protein [Chloroflexota bacterium]